MIQHASLLLQRLGSFYKILFQLFPSFLYHRLLRSVLHIVIIRRLLCALLVLIADYVLSVYILVFCGKEK